METSMNKNVSSISKFTIKYQQYSNKQETITNKIKRMFNISYSAFRKIFIIQIRQNIKNSISKTNSTKFELTSPSGSAARPCDLQRSDLSFQQVHSGLHVHQVEALTYQSTNLLCNRLRKHTGH